ncbi:hypothetical protein FRACYDRAFT_256616 [Fragilariopsis cylindrus CCMP1102]|uniref:Peptidase A1 domain-containing protein n=1 Tax=Fragilariopsis cylindrus CCMP1102 TaxID=635003 RepID=A0A1E7EJJ1_9STRA|nr:hypothetical protein FRACYDRAFT_256616 [Fragilariopsis cylindrus CCMP1102]|eukprot:OEU06069.1 hypothetical protein FRACYDRAFT_256616 [Fragilariopsis cylindrus CCMP1102]
MVTIPLVNTGQELLISYKVDDSIFKAVLDTGSPFLMIPGSCGPNTREKSGCYKNQGHPIPGLNPTTEIFDGFQGEVLWLIFGVASESIMGGPGGVFFGMIRDTDARIRPSFLGQTDVQSFRINLLSRPRTLTLSNHPLIGTTNSVPSEAPVPTSTHKSMFLQTPMTTPARSGAPAST